MELVWATEILRADGAVIAAAVTDAPAAAVPGCPGWTVADLTAHTGTIHRWVAAMVSTQSPERLSRRDLPPPPDEPADLPAWFRSGLTDLLAAFEHADLDAPMYSFGRDQSARFWVRRMVQETAVHRWDAESAAGRSTPLDAALAADGIEEFLHVFVPLRPPAEDEAKEEGRLDLRATDGGGGSWAFPAPRGGRAEAEGATSDLLLFLWGRVGPDRLTVTGGDGAVLTRWQDAVRL